MFSQDDYDEMDDILRRSFEEFEKRVDPNLKAPEDWQQLKELESLWELPSYDSDEDSPTS